MKITDLGNGRRMVEWEDGTREWWMGDVLHRPIEEGPAIERPNGTRWWWVLGKCVPAPGDSA